MAGVMRTAAVWGTGTLCVLAAVGALGVFLAGVRGQDKPRAQAGRTAEVGPRVRLEHIGLNVADPIQAAQWYVENLGMRVLRESPPPINGRFLGDAEGHMMLELYHNPPEAVPSYRTMDPLLLHVAFHVNDVAALRRKLLAAGATAVDEVTTTPAGDQIAMLRDPWGLAIQFVHRANPMLPPD